MDLLSQQMAERRERILAVARDIIAARGYEGLTMRDLAHASRVTVPTIYNLIGSKERVLVAAVEEQTVGFLAAIEASRGASPSSRVLSVVDACTRELLRLPDYYRSLLRVLFSSGTAQELGNEVNRTLVREFERGVEEMRAAGALAAWVDPKALVERLTAHLNMTSLQWVGGLLGAEGLRAAAVYGTCLILLGACADDARSELEARARRAQRKLPPRVPAGASRRRGEGGAKRRSRGVS